MNDYAELALSFTVERLVKAETMLGMKISQIVEELEGGAPSLRTLRALLVVGSMDGRMILAGEPPTLSDIERGNRLMTAHGIKATGAAVGRAMTAFLAEVAGNN